jgi:hypothetical protein
MALNATSIKRAFRILADMRFIACGILFTCFFTACAFAPERRKDAGLPVSLPFMRNDASECYYVDEFLPTPDKLVTGRSTGLFIRYYTYKQAIYKIWENEDIMLAFYSKDNRCWSLFEEYTTAGLRN